MIGLFFYACLEKASLSQVSLDFVSVVIFAAAFSSYADMIQPRSEHESLADLLRIRQSQSCLASDREFGGPRIRCFIPSRV